MDAITALVARVRGEIAPAAALRHARRDQAGDPVEPGTTGHAARPRRSNAVSAGKVAVFGAGSWGTAFSIVLADGGNDVTLWARREEVAAAINERRENADYLPGIELPAGGLRDPRRRGGPAAGPTSWCWRRRRRRCAPT